MPEMPRIVVNVNRPTYSLQSSNIRLNMYDGVGAMDKNNPIVTGGKSIPGFLDVDIPLRIQVRGNSAVTFQSVGGTLDFLAF